MIRRAENKDIPRVIELLHQVLMVHAVPRPDIFKVNTTKYSESELEALFLDDKRPVFVWTDDCDVVKGYAFCIFEEIKNSINMHDMKTLYIDDICVDENFRRHHVATDLYKYVVDFAKKSDCYRVTLNVWEVNPAAKAFYEKMGMAPLKTTMESIL